MSLWIPPRPTDLVRISVTNRVDSHSFAFPAVILSTCARRHAVDFYQDVPDAESMSPGLLEGSIQEHELMELIGDKTIRVASYNVVNAILPSGYRVPVNIMIAVLDTLCSNHLLTGAAKIYGVVYGYTPGKSAADFLEVFLGRIAKCAGLEAADAFISTFLRPMALSAIKAHYRHKASRARRYNIPSLKSTIPALISPEPSAFMFSPRKLPTAKSIAAYMHLIPTIGGGGAHPTTSSAQTAPTTLSLPSPSSTSSLKRAFSEDEEEEDAVASELTTFSPEDDDDDEKDARPLKKLKLSNSSALTTKSAGRTVRDPNGAANLHSDIVEKICSNLRSYPLNDSLLGLARDGVSRQDRACEAHLGSYLLRYVIVTYLDEVWARVGMSVHAASVAMGALTCDRTLDCIAQVLGMVAKVDFLCAVVRAYRQNPYDQFRRAILAIYDGITRIAVKCVNPLYSVFNKRSVESQRTHLRGVLRLHDAGHVYDHGLSPVEALLTTNMEIHSAIFNRAFLQHLRIF